MDHASCISYVHLIEGLVRMPRVQIVQILTRLGSKLSKLYAVGELGKGLTTIDYV